MRIGKKAIYFKVHQNSKLWKNLNRIVTVGTVLISILGSTSHFQKSPGMSVVAAKPPCSTTLEIVNPFNNSSMMTYNIRL